MTQRHDVRCGCLKGPPDNTKGMHVSEKPNTGDAYQTIQWVTLRYERGTRHYRLHLEQDLWGTWCLTRVNGRRKRALLAAAQSRRQAGYRLVL